MLSLAAKHPAQSTTHGPARLEESNRSANRLERSDARSNATTSTATWSALCECLAGDDQSQRDQKDGNDEIFHSLFLLKSCNTLTTNHAPTAQNPRVSSPPRILTMKYGPPK